MKVKLLKDDQRFGLKKGETFIATQADYDEEKIILLRRIHDGFVPNCSQYKHNVKRIK
jgi:hypothetical protein